LAKLVELPKERPFHTALVARELTESVPLFRVGIERASKKDLVPVPLVRSAPEHFAPFLCAVLSVIVDGKGMSAKVTS
jgi:hypothetical protein